MANSRNRGDSSGTSTYVSRNDFLGTDKPRSPTGGYFDSNNPYFGFMAMNIGRGNKEQEQFEDAIRDRAIEWEADNADYLRQRADARADLLEQRAYDSPEAQIARQRDAGINPDLISANGGGSVSSGSSAQVAQVKQNDVSPTTEMPSSYRERQFTLDALNTAASFVSTLAGVGSSIANGISSLKTMPSVIAKNFADSQLSGAQANEVLSLLDGKKKAQNIANIGGAISNSTAIMEQLARFSQLISPDTKDMATSLRSLGVAEENIAPYSDFIKQLHANPELRAKYASDSLKARWSEAENEQYTSTLISNLVSSSSKCREYETLFAEDYAFVQSRIQNIIRSSDKYISNMANTAIDGSVVSAKQQEYELSQLKHDISTFSQNIDDIKTAVLHCDTTIAQVYANARSAGRSLSPVEQAVIDEMTVTKTQLRTLGSSQVSQLYQLERHADRLKFYVIDEINPSTGGNDPLTGLQRHNIQSRIVFDDLLTDVATPQELAIDVFGKVLNALGTFYIGSKMGKNGGISTTIESVSNDGAGNILKTSKTITK